MSKGHLESGRQKQKQETRNSILQAASKLVEQEIPITMENVAAEANISRATIYRYYSNIDSLSTELVLQLNVPNTEALLEQHANHNLKDALLAVQQEHLNFILEHENTSKKFLGAALLSDPKLERGQNRRNLLKKLFAEKAPDMNSKETEMLVSLGVLLMGIEAVIASKDVCALSNEKMLHTLKWGLDKILDASLSE